MLVNLQPFKAEIGASLALLATVLLLRWVAMRALARSQVPPSVKRYWHNHVRATSALLLLGGLMVLWVDELRGLALSAVAVAAAIVISFKELILCLNGSFVRVVGRAYAVGDRIEVANLRGDVIEVGAFTTRLLEISSRGSRGTGRLVVVPNSLLLDKPVFNETFAGEYGLYSLHVTVAPGQRAAAEQHLLAAARAACEGFEEPARRHIEDDAWKLGLGPDSVRPTLSIDSVGPNEIKLMLRFPAPARRSGRVEQAILRRYLDTMAEREGPAPPSQPPHAEEGP